MADFSDLGFGDGSARPQLGNGSGKKQHEKGSLAKDRMDSILIEVAHCCDNSWVGGLRRRTRIGRTASKPTKSCVVKVGSRPCFSIASRQRGGKIHLLRRVQVDGFDRC